MPEYKVVVNACAAPSFTNLTQVRCGIGLGVTHKYKYDRLVEGFPERASPRQQDWAEVLGAIYAIDLRCKRGEGVDWHRNIEAWIPVRDPDLWNSLTPQVVNVFAALTYDRLKPHFVLGVDMNGPPRQSRNAFPGADGVALLSGGVDSFVGAALLLEAGSKPLLVSHMNSSSASAAINAIMPTLRRMGAPAQPVSVTAGNVERDRGGESSQRARSMLYMGVACLVADGMGLHDVWLNENGVMAVNVPLTAARSGSLSTRTASPRVLAQFSKLASAALARRITVSNKLVAFTKPEVTALAGELRIDPMLKHTVSCWQIGRNPAHCGRCVPCLIRQISHEYCNTADRSYLTRPFDAIPEGVSWGATAKDNIFHLLMHAVALSHADEDDLVLDHPELLDAGPGLSVAQSLDMHKRWASQCLAVAANHPYSRSILGGNVP